MRYFRFGVSLRIRLKKICDYTTYVHYKREMLFTAETENVTGAVIVKSGCIRVYIMSDEGREITLYRLFPEICVCFLRHVLYRRLHLMFCKCGGEQRLLCAERK